MRKARSQSIRESFETWAKFDFTGLQSCRYRGLVEQLIDPVTLLINDGEQFIFLLAVKLQVG